MLVTNLQQSIWGRRVSTDTYFPSWQHLHYARDVYQSIRVICKIGTHRKRQKFVPFWVHNGLAVTPFQLGRWVCWGQLLGLSVLLIRIFQEPVKHGHFHLNAADQESVKVSFGSTGKEKHAVWNITSYRLVSVQWLLITCSDYTSHTDMNHLEKGGNWKVELTKIIELLKKLEYLVLVK